MAKIRKKSRGRSEENRYCVPPVQRAFKLLRHIAAGDPVLTPSRTAKEIGINRTTLVRLLATLEEEGIIERKRAGEGYGLGAGLRMLCATALFSSDVVEVADPVLIKITADLKLSSHLAVLDGRDVVYLLRRVPNVHLVSNVQIGSRLPAHVVNAGRIILAYLPVERVRAIFEGVQLERFTQQTPAHLDGLLAQIHRDNQLGLAWSDSSFEAGTSSVAAPIFNHLNEVVASINVTGPTVSFDTTSTRRPEIAATVLRAAREISEQLGHGAIPHPVGKPMD